MADVAEDAEVPDMLDDVKKLTAKDLVDVELRLTKKAISVLFGVGIDLSL